MGSLHNDVESRGLRLSVYLFSQLATRNNYATWIQMR